MGMFFLLLFGGFLAAAMFGAFDNADDAEEAASDEETGAPPETDAATSFFDDWEAGPGAGGEVVEREGGRLEAARGSDANDIISTRAAEIVSGGQGDDAILIEGWVDEAIGGAGADVFVVNGDAMNGRYYDNAFGGYNTSMTLPDFDQEEDWLVVDTGAGSAPDAVTILTDPLSTEVVLTFRGDDATESSQIVSFFLPGVQGFDASRLVLADTVLRNDVGTENELLSISGVKTLQDVGLTPNIGIAPATSLAGT